MKTLSPFSLLVVSLAVLSLPTPAIAGCGDGLDGVRIACRCGDLVVSDTRLEPTDPVVATRCMGDGLIVRAPAGATSIVLDLAGNSIQGTGHGTGIRVIDGGTGGAVIVGGEGSTRAQVAGFGTGFRARGQRSVREVRNVDFVGNERDGVVLRGMGSALVDVTAERNGRDGVRAGGRNPRLNGVEAQNNGRYGLRVTSPLAEVNESIAVKNGKGEKRSSHRAGDAGSGR